MCRGRQDKSFQLTDKTGLEIYLHWRLNIYLTMCWQVKIMTLMKSLVQKGKYGTKLLRRAVREWQKQQIFSFFKQTVPKKLCTKRRSSSNMQNAKRISLSDISLMKTPYDLPVGNIDLKNSSPKHPLTHQKSHGKRHYVKETSSDN